MKIVLVSNYKPDVQQSMLRYPEMLRRLLARRGHEIRVVHPPAVFGGLVRNTLWGMGKWIGYIDKYVLAFPWLAWQCRGADLVHVCDHSNAMYLRCVPRVARVITCHDLLEVRSARGEQPARKVGRTGQRLQRWIMNSLRTAPYVICVSRKTATDLLELAPELGGRVEVIHHTLNWSHAPARKQDRGRVLQSVGAKLEVPYFLHVGGGQWYKNRPGALRIFAAMRRVPEFRDTQFVMAGGQFGDEMREIIRSEKLDGAVVEAGRVSDEDLHTLYHGALGLLFPSLEEGFGWPILEAQASGCLVITTNRAPMTEVAGGAAILIDPEQPEAAAAVIAEQWPRREELRARGTKNFAQFSPEKVASAYCRAYEEATRQQRDALMRHARSAENPQ